MSILIGADLVPTKSNMEFFESGNITELIDERLIVELNQARYRIFNLEVPLVDKETPIKKCGPNLIAPTQSVLGIKKLGVNFFTLANNHILDQGEEGLFSTINTLTDAGIAFAGAGNTLEEASKPFIFEFNGKKVGVYCCAEHEFSILSESRAGANPFDPLESLDHVQDLKNKTDYVIVLYHGGKEHYRYPSPYLQRVCRKMIEKGANLVICQHTHCIGCEEKYKSGTIVYGQGNFLFDMSENEYWQTSIVIRIKDNFEIEYIPLKKNGLKVQIPDKR
ncbi:MAG: CapA family protein [Clostridium paraputrificum]